MNTLTPANWDRTPISSCVAFAQRRLAEEMAHILREERESVALFATKPVEEPLESLDPPRINRPWIDAEDARMAEMKAAGKSVREIAKALVRSEQGCHARTHKLRALASGNAPQRKTRLWKATDVGVLERLNSSGLSVEGISHRLNRSVGGIKEMLRRLRSKKRLGEN